MLHQTELSVLDPLLTVPCDQVVNRLGPRYQCSNCKEFGSIVEIDAIGVFIRSFHRHVDRAAQTCTVCCECGRLSVPKAIVGSLLICGSCHKKKRIPRKESRCFVCGESRIHPASLRVQASVKPRFGFLSRPETETVCHKCVALGDPSEASWDRDQLRCLMPA